MCGILVMMLGSSETGLKGCGDPATDRVPAQIKRTRLDVVIIPAIYSLPSLYTYVGGPTVYCSPPITQAKTDGELC